jgi:hypothetical protein
MRIPSCKEYIWYLQYISRGYKYGRLVYERTNTVRSTKFIEQHGLGSEEQIINKWNNTESIINGVRWEYRITARFKVYFKKSRF